MLGCLPLGGCHLSEQLFLETLRAEGLPAPPAAWITHDLFVLFIKGDARRIRLHGQRAAHIPRWHTITIAVEGQTEILVNESLDAIAIIERDGWKRSQAFGTKPFVGKLASFAMPPSVRH